MKQWLSAAAALTLVLLASQAGLSQARSRIEGVVVERDGGALPRATIELVRNGQTVATTTTEPDGRFTIDVLAVQADVFELRVTLPGFSVQACT